MMEKNFFSGDQMYMQSIATSCIKYQLEEKIRPITFYVCSEIVGTICK